MVDFASDTQQYIGNTQMHPPLGSLFLPCRAEHNYLGFFFLTCLLFPSKGTQQSIVVDFVISTQQYTANTADVSFHVTHQIQNGALGQPNFAYIPQGGT